MVSGRRCPTSMFAPLKLCVTVKGLPVWNVVMPLICQFPGCSKAASIQKCLAFSEREFVDIADDKAVPNVLSGQTFFRMPVIGILEAATVGLADKGAACVIEGLAPGVSPRNVNPLENGRCTLNWPE